jgi:peptidoglycan lytic transglycosylase
MNHWRIAAFCGVGILAGFTAVNTAESSGKRHAVAARQVTSTDSARHVRHGNLRHAKVVSRANKVGRSNHAARAHVSRLRVFKAGRPVHQRVSSIYRAGKPYVIGGRTYTPYVDLNYRAVGKASWYGSGFQGRLTASGEKFDMHALTAAHPTLPLPSYVRVTNLQNRRSVVVRVNDRGPYRANRLIDVSVQAAILLGFRDQGIARVRVEYVRRAKLARAHAAEIRPDVKMPSVAMLEGLREEDDLALGDVPPRRIQEAGSDSAD